MRYLRFNLICVLLVLFFSFQIVLSVRDTRAVGDRLAELREQELALHQGAMSVVVDETIPEQPIAPPTVTEEVVNEETEHEAVVTPEPTPIEDLPSQVFLSVPFTSQAPEKNWDQPWQDACEEAAILMLDAYYKNYSISPLFARDELQRQVDWQTAQGWGGSIDIVDVQAATAWYTNESASAYRIVRYPDVDQLKQFLAAGDPILAVADGRVLPNPHFSGEGPLYHALVITGYDDETGEFITNDPGTQHGEDFRYAYSDLLNSLRDWNGGDVANGIPVVLVRD